MRRRPVRIGSSLAAAVVAAGFVVAAEPSLDTAAPEPGSVQPVVRRPLNLVLVTIDSWRPANLAAYGYHRTTMPALEAWAQTALVVPNAFATSAWTFPGIASIFTGLYPGRHGYDARGRSLREVPTLLSVLADAGFETPLLSHLPATPGLERLGRGQRWQDPDTGRPGNLAAWLRHNGSREKPFFLWEHWRGTHLPYRPDDSREPAYGSGLSTPGVEQVRQFVVIPAALQSFLPEEHQPVVDLYDSALRAVDRQLSELFEALEQTGVGDDTLLVVTADHGEELFEHGLVGHASTTGRARLYDEVIRIPLLIGVPGSPLTAPDCVVSQVDLMPTVLSLLGVIAPDDLDGIDFTPSLHGAPCAPRTVYAESILGGFQAAGDTAETFVWAARNRDEKLIATRNSRGQEWLELYDLATDPKEQIDRWRPGSESELPRLLDAFRSRLGGSDYWQRPLAQAPGAARIATVVASAPRILRPANGERLAFADHAQILGEWSGSPAGTYVIEYRVGEGRFLTEGTFAVEGNRFEYGPVPYEVWRNLAQFNPWRVRVWPQADPGKKSDWIAFTLDPDP